MLSIQGKEISVATPQLGKLSLPEEIKTLPILQQLLNLEEIYLSDSTAPNKLILELDHAMNSIDLFCKTDLNNVMLAGKVWIGLEVKLLPGTVIEGPCLIGNNSIIGPNSYLRPGTIIGRNVRVGFGTEIKQSVVSDNCIASHFAYIGHSIIGSETNIGASSILATRRLDDRMVRLAIPTGFFQTRQKKFGSVIEHHVKVGVNASLMPGTWISKFKQILPSTCVKGFS